MQDSQRSNSNSLGLGSKVEFGFGTAWEFSGNASATSGKANSKQVTEQSGLFTGEGGYHINANNVHLEGGAIASTNPSQSELTTNTLTFKDIQNESGYQAVSGSLSAGTQIADGKTTPNVGSGMPMYDGDKDNTTTKATLTEGNITLNKDSQPTQTTAKALGINTELDKANEQVEAPKDINKVLKEQQILSQAGGNVAGAVMTYAGQQAAELEAKAKQAEQEAAKAAKEGDLVTATQKAQEATAYQQSAKEWQTGGDKKQAATAVAAALSLIVAGKPTEAVVAGAASPYVNEAIKKATDSPELQALNIPAHILWGAVEAQLSGGSATAGAVAAGVGEVGAKILSETMYGKSPTELTETEKQELIHVIKGIAGVAGGVAAGSDTTAGTLATVSTGMTVAENAVEFNYLKAKDITSWLEAVENAKTPEEKQILIDKLIQLDDVLQKDAADIKVSYSELIKRSDDLVQLAQSPDCNSYCQEIVKYSLGRLDQIINNYDALASKKRSEGMLNLAIGTGTYGAGRLLISSNTVKTYLGSIPWGDKVASAGLGMGANTIYQIATNPEDKNISLKDILWAGSTSFASGGTSFIKMNAINASSAGIKAYTEGENPDVAFTSSIIGSSLGYGVGTGVYYGLNKYHNRNYMFTNNPSYGGFGGNIVHSLSSEFISSEGSKVGNGMLQGESNEKK